jgi:hypothetical protein
MQTKNKCKNKGCVKVNRRKHKMKLYFQVQNGQELSCKRNFVEKIEHTTS